MTDLLFHAQLLGLLITRDHYMQVKRRSGADFAGTMAQELLNSVNEEIELMAAQIPLLSFY